MSETSLASDVALLFRRDLQRLVQEIEAFPDDATLWRQLPGITNSAGNLALHLEGNLREYVGRQMGGLRYDRVRALEFSAKGLRRDELLARVAELSDVIPSIIGALALERLVMRHPEVVLEIPLTTQAFLVHLHGHLNWHLGQIDYLRRALTGDGAIELAGL